jgi:hypothetical protein
MLGLHLASPQPVHAASHPFDPAGRPVGAATFTEGIALGDVDLDGDLDLVFGNGARQANTLYLNEDGEFQSSPAWTSSEENSTSSVALADINGDRLLDLVCGNFSGEPSLVYYSDQGRFGSPGWASADSLNTSTIALGDLDRDRDLDLVCGNRDGPIVAYVNQSGRLDALPSWSSVSQQDTRSVALGDVDGDGDLDLVCGNRGTPNALYINIGAGGFNQSPVWTSSDSSLTQSVALGDVDSDGDLDLVCGNDGEPTTLHLNVGETFETTPTWSSTVADNTRSVALGDVDSDGDLDLFCGNDGQQNAVYLNQTAPSGGPVFGAMPSWTSMAARRTRTAAMADCDSDGDLDVVCGNFGEVGSVYENLALPLPSVPSWVAVPTTDTHALAFGDVDEDGDLDLVCANFNESVHIYRNEGGILDTIPSGPDLGPAPTFDLALGDLDLDGDLDLLLVGTGSSTVHLNRGPSGGLFDPQPAWSWDPGTATVSVALGDVDEDGDLDVVFGRPAARNDLYRNLWTETGGRLEFALAWSAPLVTATQRVMLVDIDANGHLDLAVGNARESDVIYYDQSGAPSFADTPGWRSGPEFETRDLAYGDVDGDGDLDLACGSFGQPSVIYLSDGGNLAIHPAWYSDLSAGTQAIALLDPDLDGDLDLVCGNTGLTGVTGATNSLFRNLLSETDSFSLTTMPTWSSDSALRTTSVAVADVDQDGDPDCAFGNTDAGNTVHGATANPVFPGDPQAPSGHTTNHAAFLKAFRVTEQDPNTRRIDFDLIDLESDASWILPRFQWEGDPRWSDADLGYGPGAFGLLEATPKGRHHTLSWNISNVPFDLRDAAIRVQIIELPTHVGVIRRVPSHIARVGGLRPLRPEIGLSAPTLDFETVTLGDSVFADVPVSNTGTLTLRIDNVRLPDSQLRLRETPPIEIEPGAVETLRIFLEPTQSTNVGGFIEIESNDPVTPLERVEVRTDVRDLSFEIQVGSAFPVPLGEPLPFVVVPSPGTIIEGGALFFKSPGGADLDSTALFGLEGGDLLGVVPGDAVRETGLEYRVRVDNSPVYRLLPESGFLFLSGDSVAPPTEVTSDWLGSTVEQNHSIQILVGLQPGTVLRSGVIQFREGGTLSWDKGPLQVGVNGDPPVGEIPARTVGARGVEYWIAVETASGRWLTDPPVGPANHPNSIPVEVRDLEEEMTHPGLEYRLLSIPLDTRGSIQSLLLDEVGPSDPTRWRLWTRETAEDTTYTELPTESFDRFEQGKGYWFITTEPHRLGVDPDGGVTPITSAPFPIVLDAGYNLIGNPFNFSVRWSEVRVDTLPMSVAEGLLVEGPVGWLEGQYNHAIDTLVPFQGYWVKSLVQEPITLRVPGVGTGSQALPAPPEPSAEAWLLHIDVETSDTRDRATLGVGLEARDDWDRLDHSDPPPPPGGWVSIYFPHDEWGARSGPYARDVRGESRQLSEDLLRLGQLPGGCSGHVWSFDVAKSFASDDLLEVVLTIAASETPAGTEVRLIDRTLKRSIDLRLESSYRFHLGKKGFVSSEADARFQLVVGGSDLAAWLRPELPAHTLLMQSSPNPFRRSTLVRYQLARPSPVLIRMFDVRGGRVREFEYPRREPGIYEILWDGTDSFGARVASGVYFIQLSADETVQTLKAIHLE